MVIFVDPNGIVAKVTRLYCRHEYAFWLILILSVVFIFIAGALSTHYHCWQWKTDPVAARLLERQRLGLPIKCS